VGRRVKKKKKKWKKEGKLKEEKKKQKGKKKKEKREKRERGIMDISTFTQPGEAVLPNVSTKRIQLPRRIRSTSTATAGAATAGALPNGP
jgi:hypothetical protein